MSGINQYTNSCGYAYCALQAHQAPPAAAQLQTVPMLHTARQQQQFMVSTTRNEQLAVVYATNAAAALQQNQQYMRLLSFLQQQAAANAPLQQQEQGRTASCTGGSVGGSSTSSSSLSGLRFLDMMCAATQEHVPAVATANGAAAGASLMQHLWL